MLAYKWFPDTFDDAQGWVNRFRFLFRLLGKCGVSVGAIPGAEAKQVWETLSCVMLRCWEVVWSSRQLMLGGGWGWEGLSTCMMIGQGAGSIHRWLR